MQQNLFPSLCVEIIRAKQSSLTTLKPSSEANQSNLYSILINDGFIIFRKTKAQFCLSCPFFPTRTNSLVVFSIVNSKSAKFLSLPINLVSSLVIPNASIRYGIFSFIVKESSLNAVPFCPIIFNPLLVPSITILNSCKSGLFVEKDDVPFWHHYLIFKNLFS